jgi:hypothetical protein
VPHIRHDPAHHSRVFALARRQSFANMHDVSAFLRMNMPLQDPYAFQLAGFSEHDVEEIMADLDYLHRNSRWTHRRDQIERMILESPVILIDFLRSVSPDIVRNAMIPRRVKDIVLR